MVVTDLMERQCPLSECAKEFIQETVISARAKLEEFSNGGQKEEKDQCVYMCAYNAFSLTSEVPVKLLTLNGFSGFLQSGLIFLS